MRYKAKDAAQMAVKRNDFLAKSHELFTKKNIESVPMIEVAEKCGYGTTTLYRYFPPKPILAVAAAAWIWEQTIRETEERSQDNQCQCKHWPQGISRTVCCFGM